MRRHRNGSTSEDVIVSGFADLEPIGRGGFSHVFRARQEGLERQVALKVLDGGLDTAAKQKTFERECRAMGALSRHPNIVTVFSAAFAADGRPCIVMELYEDGTLGQQVKDHGPLSTDEVIGVGMNLCDALDAAHSAGIVHRDIKPVNLFRSAYAGVVLGDFGISSFDDDRTITRSSGGLTVHYAPPELIEGGQASARSDIYSLAASLYYLLTGERPFPRGPGEATSDVARRILLQPAPVFDKGGPDQQLGELLARSMAKEPSDRSVSAAALRSELAVLQSTDSQPNSPARTAIATPRPSASLPDTDKTVTESVSNTPPPKARTPLLTRRNRSLVLGGAALLSVGALLLLGATLGRGSDSVPAAAPATTAPGEDTFFGAPATPRGLSISPVANGFEVSWIASDGAERYEVERIGSEERPLTVETMSAIVPARADERPCVVVRSVGASGMLSLDSDPICAH